MSLYQQKILENLQKIMDFEKDSMEATKDALVSATKEKRSIFAFGGGHAGILAQELFYRAGGLMTINPIFSGDSMVNTTPITRTSAVEQLEGYGLVLYKTTPIKSRDVLILHSVSGRNPIVIDMAIEARKNQVQVIAITNVNYSKQVSSRHSSGKNLYELADIVIDTHGELGDAICDIPNSSRKVGAASTITACFIMNAVISEVAIELAEHDPDHVPVFYSANLDGTADKNRELVNYFKDVIHYDF